MINYRPRHGAVMPMSPRVRIEDALLDRLVAFDLGLVGAPRVGDDQNVIDLLLGAEPVWHGWKSKLPSRGGVDSIGVKSPTALIADGRAEPPKFVPPRAGGDPDETRPPFVEVAGEILFKDEQPEMPTRRLSPDATARFYHWLGNGATAEELRQIVRDDGIPRFEDNFDQLIRHRDEGLQIPNHIEYRLADGPKQPDGATGAALRGFGDPFNLLDEVGAVVDTFGGTAGRENIWNSDRSVKDILYDNIDANRSIIHADERDHPWARAGGQAVSNLALPMGNKATTAGKMMTWGLAEGTLGGLGAGEGDLFDRLPEAARGAVIGTSTGAGAGLVRDITTGLGKAAYRKFVPEEVRYQKQIEKFRRQGRPMAEAEALARPYKGQGAHYWPVKDKIGPINRYIKLPPRWLDSEWNVLSPKGISYGDEYELHFLTDRKFNRARYPTAVGGAWRRPPGLRKYDQIDRLWYGMPTPTKRIVGPILATPAGVAAYKEAVGEGPLPRGENSTGSDH
jgi:hypothetical protein